jgi:hypothetical protein
MGVIMVVRLIVWKKDTKMGNHEETSNDSKVITNADFRGDTMELRTQN